MARWQHQRRHYWLRGRPVGLTVTDANGCISSPKSIVILEPAPIVSTLDSLRSIDCNGANNGSIDLTSSGGTGQLTFAWSNGATTEDLSGLSPGTYTLVITDSNSCQLVMGPYTIGEPTTLTVVVDSTAPILCANSNTGAIYITPSGGVGPYTYLWTLGFSGQDNINIGAGVYQVIVTDSNGCTAITTQTLVAPPSLSLDTIIIRGISCNGAQDGFIRTVFSGGTMPYTYAWNSGDTTATIDSLLSGNYILTLTDANGCTFVYNSAFISEPLAVLVTLDSLLAVSCNGLGDGSIYTTVTGGSAPYTYLWSNGDSLGDITRLNGGIYEVTVTDVNGCSTIGGAFYSSGASRVNSSTRQFK